MKSQTVPFDEIWLYDDCSTDRTAEIAEAFGANVIKGDVNRGCSHGKNVLAKRCSADWIHFHDADDELYPTFVNLALRWAKKATADVVLFAYEERNDATGAVMDFRVFDPNDLGDPKSYAIREQINPFCGLYRRDAFLKAGGYDEDPLVLYNEDVAMHIGLAFAGLKFAAETEISIINHRRLDSMSAANRAKCLQAHYHVMSKTAARRGAEQYFDEIASRLWIAVAGLAAELDFAGADKAAKLALQLATPAQARASGAGFKMLCRLSPRLAIRAREVLIRILKPRLRASAPSCFALAKRGGNPAS